MIFNNPYDICNFYIAEAVRSGDSVIDATAGNGNDTKKLSDAVGKNGRVYAFDIQSAAIDSAKNQAYSFDNVTFINDSHAKLDSFITEEIGFVIFNLGYLPGGDHSIITQAESTIEAIEKAMRLLRSKGVILLVIYRGGDIGFAESDAILEYIKEIDYRQYNLLLLDYKNRPNNPPMVAVIQKKCGI